MDPKMTDLGGGAVVPRRRGRPRKPEIDAAILEALMGLLAEGGADAASLDAIASRSGTAKTTIYRRWPSRDLLILEAMRSAVQRTHEQLEAAAAGNQPPEILLQGAAASAMALAQHPVFKGTAHTIVRELLDESSIVGERFRNEVFHPLRELVTARLAMEAERGTLRQDVDPGLLFDLVNGAVLYRALLGEPVDAATVAALTEVVLDGAVSRRA